MEQRKSDLIYKRGYQGQTHEAPDIHYSTVYSDPSAYGEAFNYAFNDKSWTELIGKYGYRITSNITKGDPNQEYDHQVWNVTQTDTQQEYVLKVVSARYYYSALGPHSTTTEMMSRTKKEAEVLKQLNHQNVVRLMEVIGLRDPKTSFPYVFIATIMEKMEGSVDTLAGSYPDDERNFRVPVEFGRQILFQIGKAVDYLHNHVEQYVIAHQAISPRNILFRWTDDEMPLFQLADFEECILYPRSQLESLGADFDRLPRVGPGQQRRIYITHCSSPDYRMARRSGAQWVIDELRTLPNDIFSVAAAVIYLTEGVTYDDRGREDPYYYVDRKIRSLQTTPCETPFDQLLRQMTIHDSKKRITAQDLTNNKLFTRLDY